MRWDPVDRCYRDGAQVYLPTGAVQDSDAGPVTEVDVIFD
jgi:hypothetical protein